MRTLAEERNITTKLLIDDLDMWDEFDIQKNQDPQVDEYYKTIMELINQQIRNGVKWLDSDDARDYFFGEAEYQQRVFQSLEEEWDNILNGSYNDIEELLEEVYHRGKQKGYSDIRSRIRYTDTDKLALAFARDYNYHLIRKIDGDTRHQIKNTIIKGVIAGEHPSKIAPKILDIAENQLGDSIFSPKQRATMIARTEISRVQNTGILQSYINEGYQEVKILTAEDDNVCYTCLRYAFEFNEEDHVTFENRGKERIHNIIKLVKGNSFPPFHPLCRCTYLSVWKSKGEPPKNPFIICLMPIIGGMEVPTDLDEYSREIVVKLTKDELEKRLGGFVDNEDMDEFLELMTSFQEGVLNTSYEWGAGIGMDGTYKKPYTCWMYDTIFLTEKLLKSANSEGLKIFVHNHPVTTVPLASQEDYNLFVESKIKYGVVTNEFGTMIIKNKDVNKSFENLEDIYSISSDIENKVKKEFKEHLLNQGINYKKLPENQYKKKFQKFARTNCEDYVDEYKKKLRGYMDITFIN